VFVQNPVGILNVPERYLMRDRDFLLRLRNQKVRIREDEWVSLGSAWLDWRKRFECKGLIYEPGCSPESLKDGKFNLWSGLAIKPQKGDIGPWRKLLDHIFRAAPENRKWFEQWVAYPLRHLGTKLFTAAVFWGAEQGAGKSLTGEVIGSVYGENYYELSPTDLFSGFNEWIVHKQFVLINEIVSTGAKKEADHLKALITREKVTVNRKYQPTYSVKDCVNYLITSNYPDAVQLDDSDRRLFVHRVEGRLDQSLAREIAQWKRSGAGRAALLHWLTKELDLEGFDPRAPAPRTAAKRNMIESSKSDLEMFVSDKIRQAKDNLGLQTTTIEDLRMEFDPGGKRQVSGKAISILLDKYGALNLGQKRVPGSKDRSRLWDLANREESMDGKSQICDVVVPGQR